MLASRETCAPTTSTDDRLWASVDHPKADVMLLEAYVLPDVDGPVGVLFLLPRPESRQAMNDRRDARGGAGLALEVYGQGPVGSALLARAGAALVTATGEAIGTAPRGWGRMVIWWILGLIGTAGLIWRALDTGAGTAFLAAIAGFLSLPPLWTMDDRPHRWWRVIPDVVRPGRLRSGTAQRLARALATLETTAGRRADTQDQVQALWAMARRIEGAPVERFAAMATHCRERGWAHVGAWYAQRAATERRPVAPVGADRPMRWITFEGFGA